MDTALPSPIAIITTGLFQQDAANGLIMIVKIEEQLWRRIYVWGTDAAEWESYEEKEKAPPERGQQLEDLFFLWCVENDVSPFAPSMRSFAG